MMSFIIIHFLNTTIVNPINSKKTELNFCDYRIYLK